MQDIPLPQGNRPVAAPLPGAAGNRPPCAAGRDRRMRGGLPSGGHRSYRPGPSTWDAVSSAEPASVSPRAGSSPSPRILPPPLPRKNTWSPREKFPALADHSRQHFKKLFGRSLQLRQVSAAGCNACEADLNVLATPFFDLARFGINFVASPRHADGIVVTGPISRNMKTALIADL